MSGSDELLTPFEGSGVFINPVRSSTVSTYHGSPTTDTGTTTVTATSTTTIQDYHSLDSVPFPFPLWAWVALLVATTLLVSVSLICITLAVGWRQRKRRGKYEVKLKSQSHTRHNSNLWIDQEQPTTKTVTDSHLQRVNTGTTNTNYYSGYVNTFAELQERKGEGSVLFSDQGASIKSDHSSGLEQSQPGQGSERMDTSLNHNLLHTQPATTVTFKHDTLRAHTHREDHYNELGPRLTPTAAHTYRYTDSTLDGKATAHDQGNCFSDGDDAPVVPVLNSVARNLELLESYVHSREQMSSRQPQPSRIGFIDFDDITNVSVTTFSQYAFNTL